MTVKLKAKNFLPYNQDWADAMKGAQMAAHYLNEIGSQHDGGYAIQKAVELFNAVEWLRPELAE